MFMPDKEQSIYLDPSLPISESFATLPADFKTFLRGAFALLAALVATGKTPELVAQVSSDEGEPWSTLSRSAANAIASQLGIEEDRVGRVFSAAMFCSAAFVNQKGLTPEEFVSAGVRLGFIAEADNRNVLLFAQAIAANRVSLTDTNKQNRLVHTLLPSFAAFHTVVDLRPSFTEDGTAIKFTVPVIIAHIVNDSTDDVWLQMSKKQVERLISDMQDVLRKLEVLERWSGGRNRQERGSDD